MYKFFNSLKNKKGFTLIELMVVIVVLGVLSAAAVPLYLGYRDDARRSEAKGAMAAVITAMNYYYQNNEMYPGNAEFTTQILPRADLDELVATNWQQPQLIAGGGSSGAAGFFIIKMQAQSWQNRAGQTLYYQLTYNRSNSQKTWVDETGLTQLDGG